MRKKTRKKNLFKIIDRTFLQRILLLYVSVVMFWNACLHDHWQCDGPFPKAFHTAETFSFGVAPWSWHAFAWCYALTEFDWQSETVRVKSSSVCQDKVALMCTLEAHLSTAYNQEKLVMPLCSCSMEMWSIWVFPLVSFTRIVWKYIFPWPILGIIRVDKPPLSSPMLPIYFKLYRLCECGVQSLFILDIVAVADDTCWVVLGWESLSLCQYFLKLCDTLIILLQSCQCVCTSLTVSYSFICLNNWGNVWLTLPVNMQQ